MAETLDAFLELCKGGKPAIEGETLDAVFSPKKAAQVTKFKLSCQKELTDDDSESEDDSQPFVLNITKEIDAASGDIFQGYCYHAGKRFIPFTDGKLTVRKGGRGQIEFLIFEMTEVYIKNWRLENSDSDPLPEEIFDLCFNTLKITYYAQKPSGEQGSYTDGMGDFGAPKKK